MTTYNVINKTTKAVMYSYTADSPIEWADYPFSMYDHVAVPDPVIPPVPYNTLDWLIDIGPFFDRFGSAKMDVLTSQDAYVKAVVQDVMVRKWVDLKRADVAQGLYLIGSKIPSVTSALQNTILSTIVSSEENMALRKMYFNNNGT
jgi:hypothetical protein